MKSNSADHCAAPQMLEIDATEDSSNGERMMSSPSEDLDVNPWPAIRQAIHAYARNPSEANALAVKESMRLLHGHPKHASH